jgi:hypothetical protein
VRWDWFRAWTGKAGEGVNVLRGQCYMCGRAVEAIEVEVPHATYQHCKTVGVALGRCCTAVCRDCARAITSSWARHGAAEWARVKAERDAAKRVDTQPPEDT